MADLVTELTDFFAARVGDDIVRRINQAAHDVHQEWASRSDRDAYVDQAIREAAYRAVHDVLSQQYVTVRGYIP